MVILDTPILAGTTPVYTVQLVNEQTPPQPIPGSTLSALTLTYYDAATLTIVNGRNAQNVLQQNGVTVDGAGLLTWSLALNDARLVNGALGRELHIALWTWTWASGAKVNRHEAGLYVEQVVSEGVTIPAPQGAITVQYVGGQLIIFVNDGGVLKQLTLGSPAA